ncbi:MAG TPA: ribonuclease HI [Chitinophagaceae bacterium]|nr:ribonuclease HI [Chitinophagaceae bacterium]HAN37560.1 ribonuclease HI [Chitinophagaceae bacterium]
MTNTTVAPITIYTDGSSRGNPGPGGYGIVMLYGKWEKHFSEGYRHTTNNRMELLAVIKAIQALKKRDIPIVLYTDSQYVVNAIEKGWLYKWIKTNFAGGKKNSDLWREYYQISRELNIQFKWVKGHADNVYNNLCDKLATEAADGKQLLIDYGYEKEDPLR